MMENAGLIQQMNKELAIELPEKISLEELKTKLSAYINDLIQQDFEKLIGLLYRIDINEAKIKSLLKHENNMNAGDIIAELIIERQMQKIKSRQQFSQRDNEFDEEEKW